MRSLLALLLLVSLTSCSQSPHYLPGPMVPLTAASGVAVLIEDHLEDPACDAAETSMLEMIDDVVSLPVTFLWTFIAFEGSLGWGLADFIQEPTQRVDFVTSREFLYHLPC